MTYDSIIFDLDGTLWDSCETCAVAWNQVVKENRITFRTITNKDVRKVTGKSHAECIRQTFKGLGEKEIQILIDQTAAADNTAIDKMGAVFYPGVKAGLTLLREKGYKLFIVSNCQSGYIEQFLKHIDLPGLVEDFECWGNTHLTKTENLRDVIQRNYLKTPLMVGDTDGDEKAARDNSISFAHVTYGFGKAQRPDFQFASFGDLVKELCQGR